MADFKVTWFFESYQQQPGQSSSAAYGWTESWYINVGSIEQALSEGTNQGLLSYVGLRRRLLAHGYFIKWVRASSVDNPRSSKTAALVQGHLTESPGQQGEPAQDNCCALIDFNVLPIQPGDRTHHRRMLFRGLPRALIQGNIFDEQSPRFLDLKRLCNWLGRGEAPIVGALPFMSPYTMRIQDPNIPFQPITSLTYPAGVPPRYIMLGFTHAAIVAGQRVAVRGVPFPRGVNRIWTAQGSVAENAIVTLGRTRFDLSGAWAAGGQAVVVRPVFRRPDQYTIIGLRMKTTGRPSRLTRGRRRAS